MSAYRWAYCKIKAWVLWRVLGIYSPSVALYGISCPVMFNGAGDYRDHRYAGVNANQRVDFNAVLRRAMERAQR